MEIFRPGNSLEGVVATLSELNVSYDHVVSMEFKRRWAVLKGFGWESTFMDITHLLARLGHLSSKITPRISLVLRKE